MDVSGALNYSQVSQQMSLASIVDRDWNILFVLLFFVFESPIYMQ